MSPNLDVRYHWGFYDLRIQPPLVDGPRSPWMKLNWRSWESPFDPVLWGTMAGCRAECPLHVGVFCQRLFPRECSGDPPALLLTPPLCGSPQHFLSCLWTLHSPSWEALHLFPRIHIWSHDCLSSFRLRKGSGASMGHLYIRLVAVDAAVGFGDQLHSACAFCVVFSASLQCSCCCLWTPGYWDGGQCGIADLLFQCLQALLLDNGPLAGRHTQPPLPQPGQNQHQ